MKFSKWILLLLLSVGLSGCGPAKFLEGLFNPEDLLFEEKLVGAWQEVNPDEHFGSISIIFEGKKEGLYDFILVEKEGKFPYEGRLGRLGGILYLDLVPQIDPINNHLLSAKLVREDQSWQFSPAIQPLGDMSFLVFPGGLPDDSLCKSDRPLDFRVVVAHQILRIELGGDRLKLWYLDEDSLKEGISRQEVILQHILEPEFLVTSPTAELQQFCSFLLPGSKMFSELGEFERKRN